MILKLYTMNWPVEPVSAVWDSYGAMLSFQVYVSVPSSPAVADYFLMKDTKQALIKTQPMAPAICLDKMSYS